MNQNHIVGVRGRKTWREFYIDGKCVDCGKTLSKDSNCFVQAKLDELKEALKTEFYCNECGLKHYKKDFCGDCGEKCTPDEITECYDSYICESGEFSCACPR